MCDAEKVKALAERANELNCAFQEFIQDFLGRLNDRVEEAPGDDKSSHTTSQPRKIQKQSGYQDVHGPARQGGNPTPAPNAQPPVQESNIMKTPLEYKCRELPDKSERDSVRSRFKTEKQQNILEYLLSIAHSEGTDISNENKTKILEIVKESGIKEKDAWLKILKIIKCDAFVANYISKQNIQMGKIDDSTLIPYTCLLKALTSPEAVKDAKVQLNIQGAFTSGSDLLKEINRLQVNVEELKLHKYFKTCTRPDTKCQEEINHIMKRCSVEHYVGAYVEGMRLPSGDTWPYLGVATSADYRSLTEELHKNKGRLSDLRLCVSSEIAASELKEPIPLEGEIQLFLPDASDIEETSKMAKALMPLNGKFWMLYFPRCGMKSSSGEMERLLQKLFHLRVKVVSAVVFPSPEKPGRSSAEGKKLQNLARQLGAKDGIQWGYEDIDEW